MKDELKSIQERNLRVEADKAGETSTFRRAAIAVITYFIAVIFLFLISVPSPFLSALVPAGGFILSTLSPSFLKKFWVKNIYKR